MRLGMIIGLALVAGSTGAMANEPVKEKKICKKVEEPDTGSHFRSAKRQCATAAEWKEMEQELDRAIRNSNSRASANPNGAPSTGSPQ